jgi:hypothetical protein
MLHALHEKVLTLWQMLFARLCNAKFAPSAAPYVAAKDTQHISLVDIRFSVLWYMAQAEECNTVITDFWFAGALCRVLVDRQKVDSSFASKYYGLYFVCTNLFLYSRRLELRRLSLYFFHSCREPSASFRQLIYLARNYCVEFAILDCVVGGTTYYYVLLHRSNLGRRNSGSKSAGVGTARKGQSRWVGKRKWHHQCSFWCFSLFSRCHLVVPACWRPRRQQTLATKQLTGCP